MVEVRWTTQAADDLDAIAAFIAADSPHYAALFVLDVMAAAKRLEIFPMSGRMVPETNTPMIREVVLGNYRLIYRWREPLLEILSVYHAARWLDPKRLA